jgi:hypothetical protein
MATATLTIIAVTFALPDKFITASYYDGTSVWVGTDDGEIHKFTRSTGAYVGKVAQLEGKILCLAVTGTQLLVGTAKGKVVQYVLSSAAYVEKTLNLTSQVTSMSVSGSILIVCTADGIIRSYTIS